METCEKHTGVDISERKCGRCIVEKRAATMMARYGAPNALQCKEIRERQKKTRIEKYGEDYNSELGLKLKEKIKEGFVKKYGVTCPLVLKEVKEKTRDTCLKKFGTEFASQSEVVKEKRIKTNRKLFGADSAMENKEILAKRKKTCIEKYGSDEVLKCKEIREKHKEIMVELYGVEHPLQSETIKEKRAQTCVEKYGTSNLMHVTEIFDKKVSGSFKRKECIMPSGAVRIYQGYENVALLELAKIYPEDKILNSIKEMPDFRYEYLGKHRRYYPDIYLPDEKRIIEVKSDYTYRFGLEQNLCKKKAVEAAGYTFEFWICNKKELVEKR
jgi:hypothetical protein